MTFREIEALIGSPLPPSARRHRAWWSNNPTNSVITCAWLDAGYRSAEVDMAGEKLVFRRVAAPAPGLAGRPPPPPSAPPPEPDDLVDPGEWAARTGRKLPAFVGAWKGLVTVPPDLDLTAPADPDWGRRAHGGDDGR
jgi:hypothetical protein